MFSKLILWWRRRKINKTLDVAFMLLPTMEKEDMVGHMKYMHPCEDVELIKACVDTRYPSGK